MVVIHNPVGVDGNDRLPAAAMKRIKEGLASHRALYAGVPLYGYGNSWMDSRYWFHDLPSRLGFGLIANKATGGYRMQDTAITAISPGEKTWVPGTGQNGGYVVVNDLGNNMGDPDVPGNRGAALASARALAAVLSTGTRIEQSDFTFSTSPAWAATGMEYDGVSTGRYAITTENGAYADVTIPGPGTYYLMAYGGNGSDFTTGIITVTQGARTVATVDTNLKAYKTSNRAALGVSPVPIRLDALTAGTIRITHTNGGKTGTVHGAIDFVAPLISAPPTMVWNKPCEVKYPAYINKKALFDYLRTIPDIVATEFPNTVVVDPAVGWNPDTMLGSDLLHPNDLGSEYLLDVISSALIVYASGLRYSELQATKGVSLKSPDGTIYRMSVANGGSLSGVAAGGTTTVDGLTDATAVGKAVAKAADAPAARTAIGAASSATVDAVQSVVTAGGGGDPTMKMSAVIFGDSIVNQAHSEYNSGTIRTCNSNGWWNHLNCRLGHRFKLLRNSGIPGENTSQQSARFQSDVVALSPGWVFIGGPTNDTSLTQATTVSNLTGMWDAADAAGIRIVQFTVTPKSNATQVVKDRANEINNWLRRTAKERKGLVLIDWSSKLSVGSSMDWKAGHINASDTTGLHPNTQGAADMGRIAAERVAQMTPAIDVLPQNNGDVSNLIVNPLQFGTAGTIGAGGSGQLSDSWRVDPLVTSSFICRKVPRTDGIPGFWQEITLLSGELKICQNVTGFGSVYNTGDQIYAISEFQSDTDIPALSSSRVRLNLIAMRPDFGVGAQAIDMEQTTGIVFPEAQYFPRQGVFQTPLVIVSSNATLRMAFQFEMRGAGTVRIGRSAMYKSNNGPGADVWAGVIPTA